MSFLSTTLKLGMTIHKMSAHDFVEIDDYTSSCDIAKIAK